MSFTKVTAAGIGTTSTVAFNFSGGLIISGVTTVSAGSTSAPTISPSGDTNTGIFFPSADTIAFAEGGTEVARFDSSGRFGIGTLTPSAVLHISSASPTVRISDTSGTASNLTGQILFQEMGTTSAMGRIGYTGGDAVLRVKTDGAQPIAFLTNDAERARIDSSGRLLVGLTTAPTAGGWNQYAKIVNQGNTGGAANGGVLALNRGTAAASMVVDQQLGVITFGDSAGNEFATIICQADAAPGANDYPGRIVFNTTADGASSPTERMRIGQDGVVRFSNNTNAYSTTGWYGAAFDTSIGTLNISRNGSNVAAFFHTSNANGINGAPVGTISITTTSTAYNTSSDYRLKENVEPVADGITRLQQLKPSRFNFIADPDKTVDGFIAHEVQEVVPEAISGEKDAEDKDGNPIYQGIDQSKLVPLLTAALQEAIGEIESLKARLTAAGI